MRSSTPEIVEGAAKMIAAKVLEFNGHTGNHPLPPAAAASPPDETTEPEPRH
jgi:hypothetical protein